MPVSIIEISKQVDALKRKAADTDCKLPKEDSQRFRKEFLRLLEKLQDHVNHTRSKNGII